MATLAQITDAARERREWTARLKLFGTIFNTYGFAALGGSLAEPFLKGEPFTIWNAVGITMGIAAHGLALFVAPIGEQHANARS